MKTIEEHLCMYAEYHRDKRNIATHFVGIPMIVFAVTILLAKVSFLGLSLAAIVAILSAIFYVKLDVRFGIVMAVLLYLSVSYAEGIAALSTMAWLSWGLGMFVVGWILQFIGHYYEGKKPAFVDDLTGLIIGPLFVVAELVFMLGMRKELENHIETQVGPTIIRPIESQVN